MKLTLLHDYQDIQAYIAIVPPRVEVVEKFVLLDMMLLQDVNEVFRLLLPLLAFVKAPVCRNCVGQLI